MIKDGLSEILGIFASTLQEAYSDNDTWRKQLGNKGLAITVGIKQVHIGFNMDSVAAGLFQYLLKCQYRQPTLFNLVADFPTGERKLEYKWGEDKEYTATNVQYYLKINEEKSIFAPPDTDGLRVTSATELHEIVVEMFDERILHSPYSQLEFVYSTLTGASGLLQKVITHKPLREITTTIDLKGRNVRADYRA